MSKIFKRQIIKLNTYVALMAGMPVIPIAVLFFQSNGISTVEIFILQTVYAFTIFILEIPSGYLADRLGYKMALFLSAFFTFIGMFIFVLFPSIVWLFVAEIILGIGLSLYSGTPSSLLYEVTQKYNHTNEYVKFDAVQVGIASVFGAIGILVSGFLAVYSLSAPFIVAALLALLASFCALLLPDICVSRSYNNKHNIYSLLKDIYRIIWINKKILWVIIYSTILLTGLNILKWIQQLYMINIGLDVQLFGVLGFLVGVSIMLLSNKLIHIRKYLGAELMSMTAVIAVMAAFVSMAIDIGIAAFLVMYMAYLMTMFIGPVFRNIVHIYTPSEIRATVLSTKNMINKMLYIVAMPILGYMLDILSLQTVSMIIAILITSVSFVAVWFIKGTKTDEFAIHNKKNSNT